jgi:hypothetical protein
MALSAGIVFYARERIDRLSCAHDDVRSIERDEKVPRSQSDLRRVATGSINPLYIRGELVVPLIERQLR